MPRRRLVTVNSQAAPECHLQRLGPGVQHPFPALKFLTCSALTICMHPSRKFGAFNTVPVHLLPCSVRQSLPLLGLHNTVRLRDVQCVDVTRDNCLPRQKEIGFVTSVPTIYSFCVMTIRWYSPHNLKKCLVSTKTAGRSFFL